MKTILTSLAFLFASSFAQAVVQEGQFFYVPVESAKYQLGSGKSATIEIQVAFSSKEDADAATQNLPKLKSAVAMALKDSKTIATTAKGKKALAAELATKLQGSGFKAQTILWNSFIF